MDTIEALAADLDLFPLVFADDQRSRVFGLPIDHIYLRGFSKVVANTSAVTSSDHNPLVVTLAL
jgi:endonuclease/exonuclease/phosphatase (EEP) superfamily protein YafD